MSIESAAHWIAKLQKDITLRQKVESTTDVDSWMGLAKKTALNSA